MAAAAELGADFRCVHLGSGPDGNFKASILLFPHSNADFHSFHLAGQGGGLLPQAPVLPDKAAKIPLPGACPAPFVVNSPC